MTRRMTSGEQEGFGSSFREKEVLCICALLDGRYPICPRNLPWTLPIRAGGSLASLSFGSPPPVTARHIPLRLL